VAGVRSESTVAIHRHRCRALRGRYCVGLGVGAGDPSGVFQAAHGCFAGGRTSSRARQESLPGAEAGAVFLTDPIGYSLVCCAGFGVRLGCRVMARGGRATEWAWGSLNESQGRLTGMVCPLRHGARGRGVGSLGLAHRLEQRLRFRKFNAFHHWPVTVPVRRSRLNCMYFCAQRSRSWCASQPAIMAELVL